VTTSPLAAEIKSRIRAGRTISDKFQFEIQLSMSLAFRPPE
jgi:hypothetical protein